LDIAEVARRSGVPASTLRFYEQKGFSLDEITRMFSPDGQPRIERQMLTAKAQELDRTIRKLSAMRDGLRHAAACPAPSHLQCPMFRRLLRAAISGAIGERRNRAHQPHRRPDRPLRRVG
jgi:DNA-binding transcriptional MerR regulator